MILDDRQDWIGQASQYFRRWYQIIPGKVSTIFEAITLIHLFKPDIILLDFHFTFYENAEGVMVAEALLSNGFQGKILTCSSYDRSYQKAMVRHLPRIQHFPGKDVEKITRCLLGSCDCQKI